MPTREKVWLKPSGVRKFAGEFPMAGLVTVRGDDAVK
jgi:hypothetical protein